LKKFTKINMFVAFFAIIFLIPLLPIQGTAGTAGSLDVPSTAFDGMSICVRAYGLTDGSTYGITISGDEGTTNDTDFDWLAGGTEDTFFFSVTTPTDKSLEIYLSAVAGTGGTLDSEVIYFPDEDDIINVDSIIDYILLIVILVLPVLIVAGVIKQFK